MKKTNQLLSIFVVLSALTMFVQPGFTADKKAEQKAAEKKADPAKNPADQTFRFAGNVTAFDKANSIITVADGRGYWVRALIDAKTSILKGQKAVKADELNKGEYVMLSYAVENGKNIAQTISVSEKPAEPAQPQPKK